MRSKRLIHLGLVATTLGALLAAPAAASPDQESILQDDPLLLSAKTQRQADGMFYALTLLGVDRVRVSLFWNHVAPAERSQRKPRFPSPGPGSPDSYPRGAWRRFDRIAIAARKTGVGLLFSVSGPGPAWATRGVHCKKPGAYRRCAEGVYKPSPREFGAFVRAAGTRYSGSYRADGETLPRVDTWSIWNEPNYPSWLLPMWRKNRPRKASDMVAVAPHHYRKLVDAAYTGLVRSGHRRDRILIGETSPRGSKSPSQLSAPIMPAEFARELYCLKANYRPYAGKAARLRDCPTTAAGRRGFARAHPGLFKSQGWAHHPYSLAGRRWRVPTWRHPLKDNVSIGNIDRLTRTLDRAASRWGRGGLRKAIWITEYGYQTTPPDPIAGVHPDRQGPLSAWGEYLAYRNPRVASTAQFLIYDDYPVAGFRRRRDPRRWVTWQSGLYTMDRKPKPFFHDYRVPIHVEVQGRSATVFGTLRSAPSGAPLTATVEFSQGGQWRALREVRVTNRRGYISAGVQTPGAGLVRIAWRDAATGRVERSRAARVP